ncbi:ribosome maturation factor RimP [Lysinibacillus yapensis]|uniref:Ribosome maturation factor RimP n=1 Tax=Ureibacillus yapensis TaxID=2304605 RepID=A0A396SKR5_9BACL|nr:ribosome maturation factor RimP [Lysinibacillus yapensis]RHW39607.1 ribosome maturation factor RimP [Lysinibacillus yapensis]
MSKVTSVIEELVTPILEELDLELVDIEFVKEGRNWFLRVYIDTLEGGIDIDQCALVSERLSEVLDEKDPIEQNYYLEVSSPGAERPLKKDSDFKKALGKFVYVKTYEPIKDMKEFQGYLTAYTEEGLELDVRIKTRKLTVFIEKEKIAKARLAIDFSSDKSKLDS